MNSITRCCHWRRVRLVAAAALMLVGRQLFAQDRMTGSGPGRAGGNCRPATDQDNEHTKKTGCWIVAAAPQGAMPSAHVFWNIYKYATRADAERAKRPSETVTEGLGKFWVFAISDSGASTKAGTAPVTSVGPLEVKPGVDYTARYMVAVFTPGMTTPVHVHAGPEAWYTVSGRVCLETPNGTLVGRAGQNTIVPAGPPMKLTAVGREIRRSLVLILHESSQPATTIVSHWTPKGLCK